ncbi:hypothetical protein LGH83_11440 [Lichenihabitans sp. PAMC28606]|uniref:rhamnan synthesis F family protein n=1 Tax=Lichenihabitans sp. PAMC28606 TaxID=2880932 RepID=UPI001D0B99C8|nr:rhamnan synthesis F family protein [Lichenihabitans sp. PAMC28606]UDL93222.1 hypothetical protein LGH83_11440 [Lichenihabitans sp. PAMC28606]
MRAAVFCHFDKHGIVDDHVIYALRCYRQYFDYICFVSASKLDVRQRTRTSGFVDRVICRENIGYDFGSWREGFESLSHQNYEEIAFINDSCYGPCRNPEIMLNAGRKLGVDLWGATINRQFEPHVQSFFMVFGEQLIKSGFASRFWRSVEPLASKSDIISTYEMGLSKLVQNEGFSIGAVVDLKQIESHTREVVIEDNEFDRGSRPLQASVAARDYILSDDYPNPSQLYWGEMFRRGAPLLKIEVLRDNPMSAGLVGIARRLKRDAWFDAGIILRHLERTVTADRFAEIASAFRSL